MGNDRVFNIAQTQNNIYLGEGAWIVLDKTDPSHQRKNIIIYELTTCLLMMVETEKHLALAHLDGPWFIKQTIQKIKQRLSLTAPNPPKSLIRILGGNYGLLFSSKVTWDAMKASLKLIPSITCTYESIRPGFEIQIILGITVALCSYHMKPSILTTLLMLAISWFIIPKLLPDHSNLIVKLQSDQPQLHRLSTSNDVRKQLARRRNQFLIKTVGLKQFFMTRMATPPPPTFKPTNMLTVDEARGASIYELKLSSK